MKNHLNKVQLLGLGIIILLLNNGCTAVGYQVGKILDSEVLPIVVDSQIAAYTIEEGDRIEVHLTNDTVLTGEYKGLGTLDRANYDAAYNMIADRNRQIVDLPILGEPIKIYFNPAKAQNYMERIFRGFSFKLFNNNVDIFLEYEFARSSKKDKADLNRIHRMEKGNKDIILASQIEELALSGGFNDIITLEISTKQGMIEQPLSEVKLINIFPDKSMTPILTAIGLVVDVIAIALLRTVESYSIGDQRTTAGGG